MDHSYNPSSPNVSGPKATTQSVVRAKKNIFNLLDYLCNVKVNFPPFFTIIIKMPNEFPVGLQYNACTNSWPSPRCNLLEDLGTLQRIFPHWTWRRRNQRCHSQAHLDLPECLRCIQSPKSHFLSRLRRIN